SRSRLLTFRTCAGRSLRTRQAVCTIWPAHHGCRGGLTLSGFVGILNLEGAPVDRALLEQMTHSLEFRGPDATGIWCDGAAGLGHTLLRTAPKAQPEAAPNAAIDKQPATLDGQLWIVA